MNEILHLRDSQLPPSLAYKLSPILAAYKPHTEPPTVEQLGERVDIKEESAIEELQRLQRNRTYHRQEYISRLNQEAYKEIAKQYYMVESIR